MTGSAAVRPRIGITLQGSVAYPNRYASSFAYHGADPVMLARVSASEIPRQLDGLDGLCLSGGGDIHSDYYGRPLSPLSAGIERARDEYELALVEAACERGLPMLGICRGCQLLNVAFGGTLHQDLLHERGGETRKHAHHRFDPERFHGLRVENADDLAVPEGARVNSHHHQAVDAPGAGLEALGWSPDGVVELLATEDRRTLLVQWHPERMEPDEQWPIERLIGLCRG